MLDKILQLLRLSCPHKKLSHPFASATAVRPRASGDWDSVPATSVGGHYIVCLDCGRKFNYDWQSMKIIR